MSRTVYERRARQTGTVVQIVDRGPNDYERAEAAEQGIDWNRWETICVDHGGVCSHAERSSTEGSIMPAYLVFYDEANYYFAETNTAAEAVREAEQTLGTGWLRVEQLSDEDAAEYKGA